MADKSDEREKTIPVLTVLKNNAILKNIFLLDNHPSFPEPKSNQTFIEDSDPPAQEIEETLLVGRHPDCNITLEHPSISRFHLRIHTNPSSQKLSVIDLSSVHGTWISGKKIEPGVRVDLNEGSTLQLGASSRVYSLHWIPLSRAYDMENPFVPQLDMPMQEQEREEEEEEGIPQIQSLGNDFEGKHLAFSDENSKSMLKNVMPSAPPLPECINSPSFSDDEVENKSTWKKDNEQEESCGLLAGQLVTGSVDPSLTLGVLCETESQQFDEDNRSPRPPVDTEVLSEIENPENAAELEQNLNLLESLKSTFSNEQSENQFPLRENHDQREILSLLLQAREAELANSSLPSGIVISRINGQKVDEENQKPAPLSSTEGLSGIENPESPSIRSEQKSRLPESLNSSLSDEEEGHQNAEVLQNVKNQDSSRKDYEEQEILLQSRSLASESASSIFPGGNILSEIGSQQFNKANQSPCTPFAAGGSQKQKPESPMIKSEQKSNLPSIWSRRSQPSSALQIQTGRSRTESRGPGISAEVVLQHQEDIDRNSTSKAFFNGSDGNEEAFTPDKENCSPNSLILRSMKNASKEEQIKDSMSYRSPSLKNEEISKALFNDLDGDEGPCTPNKENFTPNTRLQRSMKKVNKVDKMKHSSLGRLSFAENDGDEEPFTPDKENFTPNTLLLRSMKKINKIEEMKHSSLHRSSSLQNAVKPSIKIEENILAPSVTQKQTPKVLQERKAQRPLTRNQESLKPKVMTIKNRAERMPFQPLLVNSSGKSKSGSSMHSVTTKSRNSMDFAQTIEKNNSIAWEKMWYMVVDTTCLLNKESRKALQLLQGLKGTQLIIPRIVIRELDCMKRQGSLFRRKTEVFSAMQWIEECMVSTNWWVHVQSSVEEGRPIAPTPPSSPQSQYSETNGWFPSSLSRSTLGSLLEIVSPTAEDRILECALLFRRIKNDGQLVLLTNDLTLKIKAMAEGMICETAEEFRESLVNPFSERFLWADSSPRGLTWSCADDIVLREKYYSCCCFSGKAPKLGEGGAKGLKLILLHNSRYAQALAN